MAEQRTEERAAPCRVEMITVFPEPGDVPYVDLLEAVTRRSDVHTIFSIVAVLRDVSQQGLGVLVDGQEIMAQKILRPAQRCVLVLSIVTASVPLDVAPFVRGEARAQSWSLALHARCRWHNRKGARSSAGFEVLDSNPPAVVQYVKEHFSTST